MPSFGYLHNRFDKILRTHGKNVYLRRRCTCEQTGPLSKPSRDCPDCGGTGFVQRLEKHTMREQIVGNQYSFVTSMGLFDKGVILSEGIYFFCKGEVHPKYGDLIYDYVPSEQRYRCYQIEKALERRYDRRVLFYTCACEIREEHSGTVSIPS